MMETVVKERCQYIKHIQDLELTGLDGWFDQKCKEENIRTHLKHL